MENFEILPLVMYGILTAFLCLKTKPVHPMVFWSFYGAQIVLFIVQIVQFIVDGLSTEFLSQSVYAVCCVGVMLGMQIYFASKRVLDGIKIYDFYVEEVMFWQETEKLLCGYVKEGPFKITGLVKSSQDVKEGDTVRVVYYAYSPSTEGAFIDAKAHQRIVVGETAFYFVLSGNEDV